MPVTLEELADQLAYLQRVSQESNEEIEKLKDENEQLRRAQVNRPSEGVLARITTDNIAPEQSIVLSVGKGVDNLTLNIYEFLPLYLRKTRLSAGNSLTLERFVDVVLVLLDKDSSKTLEEKMSVYSAAEERNTVEELNTDFKRDGDWRVTAHTMDLFDRFIRYVVKYLYTSEIQEVVRKNYMSYVTRTDLSSVMPSSILKEMESFRKCS